MKLFKATGALAASLILAVIFAPANATSTDVVLNLEGNPTCFSLGDNSAVLEVRDNDPDSTPDSPKSARLNIVDSNGDPAGTQDVVYTVSSTNPPTLSWSITSVNNFSDQDPEYLQQVNPFNYVILKGQGNGGRVFHYGTCDEDNPDCSGKPGAIADTELESPSSNLAAVSFCYGLTQGITLPEPPVSLADLPDCREIDTNNDQIPGDLFTTGITCPPVGGEQQLIVNMALNKSNFGFDFLNEDSQNNIGVRACTCNTTLPACNPALGPVLKGTQPDDLPAAERSCLEYTQSDETGDGIPEGVNVRVPFSIQGVENPDSYICYTIDAVRYCFGHY